MIQVIGKTGMLGSKLIEAANKAGLTVCDTYVDIVSVRPDDITAPVVINCSGIAPAVENRRKLIEVCQHGPRRLAEACQEAGSRMIHVSTDAVFNRPGPHPERHFCDPASLYGRAKMLGEVRIPPHLTVRTSFIGFGRRGILSQILNTEDSIPASKAFLWNGHTAQTIAEVLILLAERHDITGLLHVPGDFQTRYDLTCALLSAFGISDSRVKQDDSYVTDRRLVSTRWRALELPTTPPFSQQLAQLVDEWVPRSDDFNGHTPVPTDRGDM